jgi:hypothetical protein
MMAAFFRILRRLDTPKLAGGEEADLSVRSAQGEVLIPTGMVEALTELQKATMGLQKPGETKDGEDGFVAINEPPRQRRRGKTVTVKY